MKRDWSKEENKRLIELCQKGLSDYDIGKLLGRSWMSVRGYRYRISQQQPSREPPKETIPAAPLSPLLNQAKLILKDRLKECRGAYMLLKRGRWYPAHLDEVIRAANKVLKERGFDQIGENDRWKV